MKESMALLTRIAELPHGGGGTSAQCWEWGCWWRAVLCAVSVYTATSCFMPAEEERKNSHWVFPPSHKRLHSSSENHALLRPLLKYSSFWAAAHSNTMQQIWQGKCYSEILEQIQINWLWNISPEKDFPVALLKQCRSWILASAGHSFMANIQIVPLELCPAHKLP